MQFNDVVLKVSGTQIRVVEIRVFESVGLVVGYF